MQMTARGSPVAAFCSGLPGERIARGLPAWSMPQPCLRALSGWLGSESALTPYLVAFSAENRYPLFRKMLPSPAASHRPMPAPMIVFDLDGTLVDTAPDLIATLNAVLARAGYGAIAYDAARAMIGGGARHMLERGLRQQGVTPAPADLDRMFADFIAYYGAHI